MDKLFFDVFKNKVLSNLIFSKVYYIHRYVFDHCDRDIYTWDKLFKQFHILSSHNYLSEIKKHHKSKINKLYFKDNPRLIEYISSGDSLDVLEYFISQVPEFLNLEYSKNDLLYYSVKYNSIKIFKYLISFTDNNNDDRNNNLYINNKARKTSDLSSLSSPSSSSSRIQLPPTIEVKWDYYNSFSVVPKSGNMELFLYLLDIVDIRGTILNDKDRNQYQMIETIRCSAEYGRIEMLDHIFSLFSDSDRSLLKEIIINNDMVGKLFEGIIKNGHFDIIDKYFNNFIENNKIFKYTDLISTCALYNEFEMMKYYHKNGLGIITNKSFLQAVYGGNLELIKWLHGNMDQVKEYEAMESLREIKWLPGNKTEDYKAEAMENAICIGNLEIIKWLHHNITGECTSKLMDSASENGHLDIVQWLHYNRTEGCTTGAMDGAAFIGHTEIVKWLHENRTEGCTTGAMNGAAFNGYLDTVKWLHENRTEGCTTDAMDQSAFYGQFEIVRWLHENRTEGCTTDAINWAAGDGHFEIVKWLHKNRTEGFTGIAIYFSALHGYIEIAKWLESIEDD